MSRSTSSPVTTTSWHGARETVFGCVLAMPTTSPSEAQYLADALRQVVEVVYAQGERHAPAGAEQVDGDGHGRPLDVLEQERGAAGLHRAVGDLGDLQVAADRDGDAAQLALVLEGRDELAQVFERHL